MHVCFIFINTASERNFIFTFKVVNKFILKPIHCLVSEDSDRVIKSLPENQYVAEPWFCYSVTRICWIIWFTIIWAFLSLRQYFIFLYTFCGEWYYLKCSSLYICNNNIKITKTVLLSPKKTLKMSIVVMRLMSFYFNCLADTHLHLNPNNFDWIIIRIFNYLICL